MSLLSSLCAHYNIVLEIANIESPKTTLDRKRIKALHYGMGHQFSRLAWHYVDVIWLLLSSTLPAKGGMPSQMSSHINSEENRTDSVSQFVTFAVCGTPPSPETFIIALIGPH